MSHNLSEKLAQRNPHLSIITFIGVVESFCKLKQEDSSLDNGHDNCDQVIGLRPHYSKPAYDKGIYVTRFSKPWCFLPRQPKKCIDCHIFKKSKELKKSQSNSKPQIAK